jgi:NAD-dependent dihydropyrimidine dehydrogenase PreA subunit
MGLFITVKINEKKCATGCKACVDSCPVDIFILENDRLIVSAENEDECTLCGICLQRCPAGSIELIKNY